MIKLTDLRIDELTNCGRVGRRKRQSGFTLIEVIAALAIVALAVVPLLIENGRVLQATDETRTRRHAWILLAQKMAELEMDETLFQGEGTFGSGDFLDLTDDVYQEFTYDYEVVLEQVQTQDPASEDEEPKEIFRLTLTVNWGEETDRKLSLSGYVPIPEEETP